MSVATASALSVLHSDAFRGPGDLADVTAKMVGGKAHKLLVLHTLGLPVPPFFVLPVGADCDRDAIIGARRRLPPGPVAVRSSAVGEDAAGLSFAGQFDTRLEVDSDEALLAAIAEVRASVTSERLTAYAERHGVPLSGLGIAVVVQAMFPSDASGVLFTVDPAATPTDDAARVILISAGWGLGEGIVSGRADADVVRLSGRPGAFEVTTELADKRAAVVRGPSGGTVEAEVPEARRHVPCLTDAQAVALADLGLRLEAHFGLPQDIEWAVDAAGSIALLQSRPLTGVGPRTGVVYTWDNSNIVESYSGVTTPLTYSFARTAYETVYRQFCELMGVTRQDIEANAAVFKAMIGLIRGRVYYRLDSWYRCLLLLPGARYNKRFMEQMMGVAQKADLGGESRTGKLRIAYLVWKLMAALGSLGSRTERFRTTFRTVYDRWHGQALETLPAEDLVAAYRELERELLLEWKAPIINDFFAMIFFGVLKKMAPELHNDLLCGEPGMESTLPTREILAMAKAIRDDPTLRQAIEAGSPAEGLAAARAFPAFESWLVSYLDRYGDRCMEELKLETRTLRDDPTFLVSTLRNYVGRADLTSEAMDTREASVRRAAEDAVVIPFGKRTLFRWILRRARRHVRERENLRFARTRVFGLVRRLFRALGGHFVRVGLLDEVDDVFYLEKDEVFGLVEGTGTTVHVKPLVASRRAEFERYRRGPSPDARFETRGGVHFGNPFVGVASPTAAPSGDPNLLSGLGCAPGIVRERARIVHSPKDDVRLDGQILVCERTDPGWVPLFPTAGGLLVERGSALSHSAIVAREFGIPTVVGIPGLMKRVRDGQMVELDGKAGTARLLPDE
ncbi:MAG: phosphoenolpyruvate synthase [Myxococcales bacterium]|nr:phosphoenolpyruvate synthase [Myxococcales bacterium]